MIKILKKSVITLILFFFLGNVNAKKVDVNTIQLVAKNIFVQKMIPRLKIKTNNDIKNVIPGITKGDTLLYIVNFENSFVIISADDITTPIIGYSLESKFDPDSIPPALEYLINSSKEEIKELRRLKVKQKEETKSKWSNLISNISLKSGTPIVGPLLQTLWDQDGGFNNDCPNNCPAGCVAVAMAQILYKWGCLVEGTGSHSYFSDYRLEYADFASANYQWADMDIGYSDADNRQLIYHCGVAVDMDYGPDGSGAYDSDAKDALINYFGFKSTMDFKDKSWHPFNWKNLLKSDLDHGWPIYYSGDGDDVGHAWVVDGYDSDNLFHCNMGYGGSGNTYYELGYLYPEVTVYVNGQIAHFGNQGAILGIEPIKTEEVEIPVLNNQTFTYNANGYNLSVSPAEGATSYEWTTTSGTISGSDISVTLYTDKTATVQVRAYNEQCEIYSSYDAATITINYGPMSAPDLICYSGSTVSVQNVPSGATVTWGGAYVSYPNGNTGTSVTVRAISSTNSYNGTVTATISVGGTSSTLSKAVWVGPPKVTGISGDMSVPTFQNTRYYPIYEGVKSSPTDYEWYVNPDYGVTYNNYGLSTLVNFSNIGYYQIVCSALNTCGWGNYYFSDFINVYGSYSLMITPNPSSGETTISIETGESGDISAMGTAETAFDETAEWELEVFDNVQNLKEKKIKLKGKNASINTQNWKEGVYLVRARYKDEFLTGKLVVNK